MFITLSEKAYCRAVAKRPPGFLCVKILIRDRVVLKMTILRQFDTQARLVDVEKVKHDIS